MIRGGSARLTALELSAGDLSPAFDPDVLEYVADVPFSVTSVNVSPSLEEEGATALVDGQVVASGAPSAEVALTMFETPIEVVVSSSDGLGRTYVVLVRRPSVLLQDLQLSSGTLSPAFDPNVTEYDVQTNFLTPSLVVTATSDDPSANLRLQGDPLASGEASSPLPLAVGGNTIDVDVSLDKGETRKYRLSVTRASVDTFAQNYLKASNTGLIDLFGSAVALDRDTLVVGARGEASGATAVNGDENDNSASGAGAAYVFVRQGANWSQQAYLKPDNADASDAFGTTVAIFEDTIVVGAPNEDSAATGVNGDPFDNTAPASGAVYVFVRGRGHVDPGGLPQGVQRRSGRRFRKLPRTHR